MIYESESTDSDLDAPTMKRIDVQPVIEQIGRIIIDGSPRLMIASEQSLQAVKNKKWNEEEVQSEGKSPLKGKSPMEKNVAVTTPSKKPNKETMNRQKKEPETEMTLEESIKEKKKS